MVLVVKNLPAMQEMQEMRVRSLGWEDPLEQEMATRSSILAWKFPGGRILVDYKSPQLFESAKSQTQLSEHA